MSIPFRYAAHQIRARLRQSVFTVLSVALVVGVFAYLLCISEGLRRVLKISADPALVIVVAEAATAESNSALSHEDALKLATTPGVAHDDQGRALLSCEYVVQANVRRRGESSSARASAIIRGLEPEVGNLVRPDVALVEGRWFAPGADELIVGVSAAYQFDEGRLGSKLLCGDRLFSVVGLFRAGGGAHESEFWGYAPNVAHAYRRTLYSSATMRLVSSDSSIVSAACGRIASSTIAMRGIPSPVYYESQGKAATVIEDLALFLAMFMSMGAIFAATNMMHATISLRTREIGVLRAIGYSRMRIVAIIILESLILAVVGGIIGTVTCAVFLSLRHTSKDLVGSATFSSVAFSLNYSARCAVLSLAIAAFIGLVGGFWPAQRAGRLSITSALRST